MENYENLLKMVHHRNLLSHLYDSVQFEEIYLYLKSYAHILFNALDALEE